MWCNCDDGGEHEAAARVLYQRIFGQEAKVGTRESIARHRRQNGNGMAAFAPAPIRRDWC